MSVSNDTFFSPSFRSTSSAGLPFPRDWSLADLRRHLGDIPLERVRLHPAPGTATEADAVSENEQGLFELIDGTLVRKAMGQYESELAGLILHFLHRYLDTHDLGKAFAPDLLTRVAPGQIRAPDVAFVRWERLPAGPRTREPVLPVAPHLAIEVLSASNTPREMERKRHDYFHAQVEQVWEIDPATRDARVYRGVDSFEDIPPRGVLTGGEILPGFELSLAELFERADRNGPRSL